MPYDQARYDRLIRSAALDCSFYKGTIQDQSAAQRAMSFVGAPTWGKINGLPCLKQNAVADGATSAAVANMVDVTGSFTVETLILPCITGTDFLLRQGAGATGGFICYWQGAAGVVTIQTYGAAGAAVRSVNTLGAAVPSSRVSHVLFTSIGGAASGVVRINGIPAGVALAGAGAPINCVPSAISVGGNAGIAMFGIIRAYPFALTNEDATCLAAAASQLVGGW